MPISKIEIDSILGLTTNRNETSGINSPAWSSMSSWAVENTSSGATNPNTLQDCTNIIISRNKQAAARTAFAEVWDFGNTYGMDSTFVVTGMYAIPNSILNSTQFTWVTSTAANIGYFTDSVDNQMTSAVNIVGSNSTSSNFSGVPNLLPDFTWSYTTFPVTSFNVSHFSTSYSNVYIFSSNGVFRSTTQYVANPTGGTYSTFKRVTLPVVKSLSAQITASPTDASRWFPSGSLVDIKIVVTDQLSGTQVYQGKPSRTLTITNVGTLSSIQITFAIDNTNIFLNSGGIGVYRTISYLPTDTAPPSEFYKCYEASFTAGTTAGSSTTFTAVELILNDTSIQGFAKIYTSLNAESGQAQSAESAAPPSAFDVISYNNFTVYGNVMCPPFAPLTMTALPNTDNLDMLTVGATTVPLSYIPNSTTPPANDGVINLTTGSYQGVNSSPNGGKGYNVVIRPQDPTVATGSATPASYSVAWYAIAQTLVLKAGGTGATQNINITPLAGELFDITQFPATGIVAVVQTKTTGNVVALFSYQSFAQDTTNGYYTFSNCLAYGVPFTDLTWTDATGKGLPSSGAYPIYALKGTVVTALSTYAIGADANTVPKYGGQVGFSLLPTYDLFPTRPFNPTFVGTVISVTQPAVSSSGSPWQPVVASIDFIGLYAKNSGQLLVEAVTNLCDSYNTNRLSEDPYAVYNDSATAPAGQVRFESLYSGYNRFSTYAANSSYTNGNGYYDAIKARYFRTAGTPTVKFSEPITSTLSNIMQQSVQTLAGLTASKYNKPEEIPIGQNLTPLIVGDPLKPIIKLVNQYNQMLIFKQNEGTYRTDIQGGGGEGILPVFNILTLLDNTAWLLLPESVQVFEGTVVYFSNKAFVSISSAGQINEISPTIATELLNEYSIIYNNGDISKVRSWIIAQQRLYCCTFPHVNDDNTSSTYVFCFNTGQWTKWSGEISQAAVSATGLLTLVENIYVLSDEVTSTNELQLAQINVNNKYWTVIRQADFQNPSNTQIEDIIPFTTFTLTPTYGESYINIIISNFTSSSVYKNLYKLLMLYKNRTMWYQSITQGYFSTILVAAVPNVSITLQLVNNIYEQAPIIPVNFVPSTSDFLVTTVNTALYFNKFFIANPRGSTISHYNEVQIYTQEGYDYSNIAVGFNSTGITSQYIYTGNNPIPPVSPPNAIIVTTTGLYVTLNQSTYELFTPYYILSPSTYVFRVLVPLNAARGRFIQIAVLHDTPNEVFIMNSVVYIYRDLNSTKIKAHN